MGTVGFLDEYVCYSGVLLCRITVSHFIKDCEYTPLYKKCIKKTQNKPMETTFGGRRDTELIGQTWKTDK